MATQQRAFDERRHQKVTVLKRREGWSGQDIERLTKVLVNVRDDPNHPDCLLIKGSLARLQIERLIDNPDFDHEIIQVLDSDELPFRPDW